MQNIIQLDRNAFVEVSTGSITKSVFISQKNLSSGLNSLPNQSNQINIYPNPTSGFITIDFDSDAS